MDLAHLHYLQAIARAGSLTGAARALQLSQPTLTVAMRRLEQEFGTTLLLRDRSGVRLTSTGQELLHYAGEVLSLLERAEQRINGLQTDDVGSFIIGCPETLGAYFLPTFMHAFLRDAPRISLSLWNGPSRAVEQAVLDRTVHFGLVVNPLPHPELVLVELFHDATDLFVAATTKKSSLADAHKRLRQGPLVYAGNLPQHAALLTRLSKLKLVPDRRLVCGTLELVKSLVMSDVGVAIIPRRVAAYGAEGKLRRLHPSLPFIPDTIRLAFRSDLHRTRASLRLKDALVAHGRRHEARARSRH
jgi:DNA-binding transcriptional LysR family regulator